LQPAPVHKTPMPRSVRAVEPGKMTVEKVAAIDPGPGEVELRVTRCGICGSDLHFFHGKALLPAACPGHEISAVVERVGEGVSQWEAGDEVVVEPIARCGRCDRCVQGDYHLCPYVQLFGIHLPGGMADTMVVPQYCLYRLPAGLGPEIGAMAEPLAVGVHAARLGNVGRGSRVLVLGAGAVGLLAAVACKHLGADDVAITARHDHQKRMATTLGCDQVLDPAAVGAIEGEPSVVIETVGGSASTIEDGMLALAKGGSLIVIGLFDQPLTIDPLTLIVKEAHLVGCMVYNRPGRSADFEVALEILAGRKAELAGLVTHTFAIDDVQAAFETASDKRSGAIKVLLSSEA
jgi:2-desacetyl-2-hydroxyethyl bacteriochlorophyllide A dehydrogenase